ncbi:hypothetical protein B0T24DRAFT_681681 [Lasiosphaeria ovina]|uniref:(4-O-methyl)-D-glucuronate--lignin esterase n=1 Tax=Lasiosphaeria ovina TaxID=92902 RepID=A0AAE0N3N1_9PEZI|nr:hypothetical protein B0T24DRAFT_681681 [Lasiosphaeria ovina]
MNDSQLDINITHNGRNINLRANISLPDTKIQGLYPALISLGSGLPRPRDLAVITLYPDEMAANAENIRGKGKFFDLYGRNYDKGAIAAWTWLVSREDGYKFFQSSSPKL